MRMVQRKMTNKLGIQTNSFKTDKRQANTKSSVHNYDGKSKGADLKTKKMKKSRSIKRPEPEGSIRSLPKSHGAPRQPGKPPPPLSPAKTPSPKKPSPCKSPGGSPNYMKSTSSSQARKGQTKVNISSSSNLHRVSKSLGRISSLKKVRTLTKTPSFKHTRTGGSKCSKVVLCENIDAQKATCSSTLKDSKFPPYLILNPEATEAEGTSAVRVCPYNYCSLNGHHHTPVPPLKSFLSSRRRLLKTQRVVKPRILSPSKAKPLEKDVKGLDSDVEAIFSGMPVMLEVDQNNGFFIKIYAPESEIVAHKEVDQSEDSISSDMNSSPEPSQEENRQIKTVQDQPSSECTYDESDQEAENSTSTSLDEYFGENSDMEWEEGQISVAYLENTGKTSSQGHIGDDQDVPDFNSDNDISSYLEELVTDKLLPHHHEEITEWRRFSDTGSMSDSKSSQQGDNQIEEPLMIKEENYKNSPPKDDITVGHANLELKSSDEQVGIFSNTINEVIEAGSVDLDCYKDADETQGDEVDEDNYTVAEIGEQDYAGFAIDNRESIENERPKIEAKNIFEMKETHQAVNNNQAESDQKGAGNDTDASISLSPDCQQLSDENSSLLKDAAHAGTNEEQEETEAKKSIIPTSRDSEELDYSDMVKLHSNENSIGVKALEMEESNKTAEIDAIPEVINKTGEKKSVVFSRKGIVPIQELADNSNKLKSSTRCQKADKESEEVREFNPREPNFLPIQPEPEPEKVDLRHQDMEERRNAEQWMLDHALQKTVNQLAPARKRKVALLVEAFESVMPIPEWDSHLRRNSSGFAHARPIQACS